MKEQGALKPPETLLPRPRGQADLLLGLPPAGPAANSPGLAPLPGLPPLLWACLQGSPLGPPMLQAFLVSPKLENCLMDGNSGVPASPSSGPIRFPRKKKTDTQVNVKTMRRLSCSLPVFTCGSAIFWSSGSRGNNLAPRGHRHCLGTCQLSHCGACRWRLVVRYFAERPTSPSHLQNKEASSPKQRKLRNPAGSLPLFPFFSF